MSQRIKKLHENYQQVEYSANRTPKTFKARIHRLQTKLAELQQHRAAGGGVRGRRVARGNGGRGASGGGWYRREADLQSVEVAYSSELECMQATRSELEGLVQAAKHHNFTDYADFVVECLDILPTLEQKLRACGKELEDINHASQQLAASPHKKQKRVIDDDDDDDDDE
jgi:hypothetical protein